MSDLIRRFFVFFGARYVTLIDHDGGRNVRRVEFRGGEPFARRFDFDIANVWLLGGGKVSGVIYVDGWEPYEPGAKRVLPTYQPRPSP